MVTRLDIINYLIKARRYTSYLEIGMDNPAVHFQKVRCAEKESVDPYDLDSRYCTDWTQEKLKEYLPFLTYRMTSDQFFSAYPQKKYDVIFIDGLHLENQVDRDISNALKHLNPGGSGHCTRLSPDNSAIPIGRESDGGLGRNGLAFRCKIYIIYALQRQGNRYGLGGRNY